MQNHTYKKFEGRFFGGGGGIVMGCPVQPSCAGWMVSLGSVRVCHSKPVSLQMDLTYLGAASRDLTPHQGGSICGQEDPQCY